MANIGVFVLTQRPCKMQMVLQMSGFPCFAKASFSVSTQNDASIVIEQSPRQHPRAEPVEHNSQINRVRSRERSTTNRGVTFPTTALKPHNILTMFVNCLKSSVQANGYILTPFHRSSTQTLDGLRDDGCNRVPMEQVRRRSCRLCSPLNNP